MRSRIFLSLLAVAALSSCRSKDASKEPPMNRFLSELFGLWSGPATQTPVGSFPMMNVDFRPMGEDFVWGRVDLDPANALRFGYAIETQDGKDQPIYRNGGYFQGMLRDDRAVLTDHSGRSFRFCHLEQGCEYIDATYTFSGEASLLFDVKVMGAQHVLWDATRLEEREVPKAFLDGLDTVGSGNVPLPSMPELVVGVTWSAPLPAAAQVWGALSVETCSFGSCVISRHTRTLVAMGSTSGELHFPEVHSGTFRLNVVLDRNSNIESSLAPDSGDGIGTPNQSITIAPSGETQASSTILVDL